MADFFQNGSITTLQNLLHRPLADVERELRKYSRKRNMVLLLPALYTEFEGPAMEGIIEELKGADYLYKIVLSLDKADEQWFHKIREIMSALPGQVRIIWHDGPRMQKLSQDLEKAGFWLHNPGKGRSVWMSLGYILSDAETYAIGLHDCDIVNYSRELIARLFYPVVHPALDFEFSKGYYARVTDRLYGRVTRLFYTPLIRSLKKMLGYNRFLEYLDSFRYALTGEFAFISSLAQGLRISPTWGLEVSMLSEVYMKATVNRVAQVEIMETYEHKHQELNKEDRDTGLLRMALDITKTLLLVLSQDGIIMSGAFFRSLLTTYIQESRISIERYFALATINGLTFDRHTEIEAVETFVEVLKEGIAHFIEDPVSIPMLSAWVRVRAALPDFADQLFEAVEMDNS
jgi:glucosyl-3-phosphoglycerate synthase